MTTDPAPAAVSPRKRTVIALIVASSLIMQQLDATALATALPSMATTLGVPISAIHSVITVYLLALTVTLPLSAWIADRFGARRVFCAAIVLFVLASITCATATNLELLCLYRALQGAAAAMMLPTARLILVRSVPKADILPALALMSMPAIIGPVAGPLFGGLITTVSSWQWIFWLNVPVGMISLALTLMLIDKVPPEPPRAFDFMGFCLIGVGLGALILWLDLLPRGGGWWLWTLLPAGLAGTALYARHARRRAAPILDLGLFRYASFRANMVAGSLFRIGFGALPFLLPLMMQEIFRYSPLESGAITATAAIGAFGSRIVAQKVLQRFGFRHVLVWNGLVASLSIIAFAAFPEGGWPVVMMAAILLGGVFRALEFTALNALSFAEISAPEMSHATSMTQMALRFSQAVGVASAAFLLHLGALIQGGLNQWAFNLAFIVIGALSALASLSFLRLRPEAGADLIARRAQPR